jgi:hypothetical protein
LRAPSWFCVKGPNPRDWFWPLHRSPRFGALIDDRSLAGNEVRISKYLGVPGMPEALPEKPVDFALLPSHF